MSTTPEARLQAAQQYVRVCGYFALVTAACLLLLYFANIRAHFQFGAKHMGFLGCMAAYGVVVGWGLLRLRKWAAVLLALPLSVTGVTLAALTIANKPTLTNIALAVFWAAVLCIPAVITGRAWQTLC